VRYGVAAISRLLKIIGLFCRISSLLSGSFVKETCNFKAPTDRSHPPIWQKRESDMEIERVIYGKSDMGGKKVICGESDMAVEREWYGNMYARALNRSLSLSLTHTHALFLFLSLIHTHRR